MGVSGKVGGYRDIMICVIYEVQSLSFESSLWLISFSTKLCSCHVRCKLEPFDSFSISSLSVISLHLCSSCGRKEVTAHVCLWTWKVAGQFPARCSLDHQHLLPVVRYLPMSFSSCHWRIEHRYEQNGWGEVGGARLGVERHFICWACSFWRYLFQHVVLNHNRLFCSVLSDIKEDW